jgi:polar amino acid transport system substrate-binding protein
MQPESKEGFIMTGIRIIVLTLLVSSFALPSITLADGNAPDFGNCDPTGETGSISLSTVEPDTLIVATVLPSNSLWNGSSAEDTRDGFEYCIAAEIAQRAALKHLKVMNLAWDQFINGSATGYDIGMASTSETEKRREIFDFSQPYFSANLGIAIKVGNDVNAENLRDRRIGVLKGNLGADWVINKLKPNTEVSQYQSGPEMMDALKAGQIDAVMTDVTLLLPDVARAKGELDVVGQYETNWGINVITPKGSPNTPAVDEAIDAMKKDGTLAKLSATYLPPLLGRDPSSIPVWLLN